MDLNSDLSVEVKADETDLLQIQKEKVEIQFSGDAFTINPVTGVEAELVVEFVSGRSGMDGSCLVNPNRYIYNLEMNNISHFDPGANVVHLDSVLLEALVVEFISVHVAAGNPQFIKWMVDRSGKIHVLEHRPILQFNWDPSMGRPINIQALKRSSKVDDAMPWMVFSLYRNIIQQSLLDYLVGIGAMSTFEKSENWLGFYLGKPTFRLDLLKAKIESIYDLNENSLEKALGLSNSTFTKASPAPKLNFKTIKNSILMGSNLKKNYLAQLQIVSSFSERFSNLERNFFVPTKSFSTLEDGEFYRSLLEVIHFHYNTEAIYFSTFYSQTIAKIQLEGKISEINRHWKTEISVSKLIGDLEGLNDSIRSKLIYEMYDFAQKFGFNSIEFREACLEYKKEFYFLSDSELDLRAPRLGEEPGKAIEEVRRSLQEKKNPPNPSIDHSRKTNECILETKKLHSLLQKTFFDRIFASRNCLMRVEKLRELLSAKDKMRIYSSKAYYLVRLYLLEAGKRLASMKLFHEANDIFYGDIDDLILFLEKRIEADDFISRNQKHKLRYLKFRNFD